MGDNGGGNPYRDPKTGRYISGGTSDRDLSSIISSLANKLSIDNRLAQMKKATEQAESAKSQELKDEIPMSSTDRNFFLNGDIGRGGMRNVYEEYMKQHGISQQDIEQIAMLMSQHSGYNYESADKAIIAALESNSQLGRAFETKISFEEGLYKMWIKHQASKEDSWKMKVYDGEKQIYRRGERKEGVEPWTTREDGADMGYGGIGYDHTSTVESMLREGYHILGGVGLHHGSPGESEITFVKYRKR